MAFRRKETPSIIIKATTRVSAMKQIEINKDKTIDYGGESRGELTAATLQAKLTDYAEQLEKYNQILQQAGNAGNSLKALEAAIASDHAAVLKSAYGKFGENSNEVEMLGGTKKDERKRRTVKKAMPPGRQAA